MLCEKTLEVFPAEDFLHLPFDWLLLYEKFMSLINLRIIGNRKFFDIVSEILSDVLYPTAILVDFYISHMIWKLTESCDLLLLVGLHFIFTDIAPHK